MFCIFYQYIQSLKIFAFNIVYICPYKYLPFSKILRCRCRLYAYKDYNLHQKKKKNKSKNKICIPITFNSCIKSLFSNKKYLITIQTRTTQILKVYLLLKNRISKDCWCTKSINYHFFVQI